MRDTQRGLVVVALAVVVGVALWPRTQALNLQPVVPTHNETQTPPASAPPAIRLGSPVVKEVSVGQEQHKFVEQKYTPPYVLPQHESQPKADTLRTVEDTMASYTSAMQKSRWSWWFSMWDAPSQAKINNADNQPFRRPTDPTIKALFMRGWKAHYAGRKHELVSRIELPGYTLVYMRRHGEGDDSRDLLAPVVLKKSNNRWVMTHDLQEHIVSNLRFTDKDVQVRTVQ